MERDNKKVLTLGIFAHANAGKTTITEHLLYHTNVIDRIGRVDTGDTVTDNMNVEKERGITVRDSLVSFELGNKTIQLIDTPGHIDFSAEVERAISVLDGAILVISGVEGLEAQTYTIWRALQQKNVPVIIFINKMDRRGANYERVVAELHSNLNIPTITLKKIFQSEDGSSLKVINSKIEEIIDELSAVDEDMFEKYINNEEITNDFIADKIIKLSQECKLFPVIGGSALNDIGIEDLITSIQNYIPITKKNINDELSAFVYTVRVDENGKNAYVKIINGTIEVRDVIKTGEETTGKIKSLYMPIGSKLVATNSAASGDIVVINGLDVKCGQILGKSDGLNRYILFVKPLLTMEINPIEKRDTIELMNALRILNEEDPYLNVRYNEKTNSIYISLMGEVQSQIVSTMLEERFGLKTIIEHPIVIHKEVPMVSSKATATYTTVSGIGLEVTPLERGSGFIYKSKVSTDYLHLKYQRQIERLINYYVKQGLYGWELTDIEVALIDGQFDSMGSDPMHFNIITPLALFRCLKQAKMRLLEPICHYTITTPEEHLSLVVKSLTNKNSSYEITKHLDLTITIEGEAPVANMLNYPLELSKITRGRGAFASSLSRYELSPNKNIENNFIGPDPRNETTFVISDMKASLEPLDKTLMKKKKESRSKFARQQKEKDQGKSKGL
jgi:ribosomal protection tetracycline resistance protein